MQDEFHASKDRLVSLCNNAHVICDQFKPTYEKLSSTLADLHSCNDDFGRKYIHMYSVVCDSTLSRCVDIQYQNAVKLYEQALMKISLTMYDLDEFVRDPISIQSSDAHDSHCMPPGFNDFQYDTAILSDRLPVSSSKSCDMMTASSVNTPVESIPHVPQNDDIHAPMYAATVSDDPPAVNRAPNEQRRCNYARPERPCTLCPARHRLWHCPKFREMSVIKRLDHVNSLGLCHNCFLDTHATDRCGKKSRCYVDACEEKHSMWIHTDPDHDPDISSSTTLVSHARCDLSLSQSTVNSAISPSLPHSLLTSHHNEQTHGANEDQSKSPVRYDLSIDSLSNFMQVNLDGVVKMIESLKYLLESMSSSIEKCTRLIPELCLMSDHAHVSSHCENKSRSVCMKAVSTMTNPPALHVFTNHDDSTTKPADVNDQHNLSRNDSGFMPSIENMFVDDWFT